MKQKNEILYNIKKNIEKKKKRIKDKKKKNSKQ